MSDLSLGVGLRAFPSPRRVLVLHAALGVAAAATPLVRHFPFVEGVLGESPSGYVVLPAVSALFAGLVTWVALRMGRVAPGMLFALCPFGGALTGAVSLALLMVPQMQEPVQLLGFVYICLFPAFFGVVAGLLVALSLLAPVAVTSAAVADDALELPKIGSGARAALACAGWLGLAGVFALLVGDPSHISQLLGAAAVLVSVFTSIYAVRWLLGARRALRLVRAGLRPGYRLTPFDGKHDVLEELVAWNATYRDPMPQNMPVALVRR